MTDPRTFKLTSPSMEGDDVRGWQEELVARFKRWNIDYPLNATGRYGQATRAAERSFLRAWGVLSADRALEHGMTPELRTILRHDRREPGDEQRFLSAERKAYRAALREKYDGGGVAMPVGRILADSNDWAGKAHDGIDLICLPNAPLYAIVRSKVVRAVNYGWWGAGAPVDPVLKARGDGIVIIQALVDAGPIKKGDCFGYGHAEGMRVKPGDVVEAGEWIANAGFANAWHPHWMRNTGTYAATIGRGDADPRPVLDYLRRNA